MAPAEPKEMSWAEQEKELMKFFKVRPSSSQSHTADFGRSTIGENVSAQETDVDNSGTVSRDELYKYLRTKNIPDNEIKVFPDPETYSRATVCSQCQPFPQATVFIFKNIFMKF